MARPNSPTTDPFWELPARQLRAELATETDMTIAARHGVKRMVVSRVRKAWGIAPQRVGKPKQAGERPA